jgi:hypothetical protein
MAPARKGRVVVLESRNLAGILSANVKQLTPRCLRWMIEAHFPWAKAQGIDSSAELFSVSASAAYSYISKDSR